MDVVTNEETNVKEIATTKEIEENAATANSEPFSKLLEEIMGLMHTLNQRLENMSRERRTKISQMQWVVLEQFKNSSDVNDRPEKFWQDSLFTRTYFINQDLDESFNDVMKYRTLFFDRLKKLNDKVQCSGDSVVDDRLETLLVPQLINNCEGDVPKLQCSPNSNLAGQTSTVETMMEGAGGECILGADNTKEIEKFFVDLLRAKIEFDTQFLNFNAVLSKKCYSDDFHYLYKIYSNSNAQLKKASLPLERQRAFSVGAKKLRRKRLSTSGALQKTQKQRSHRMAVQNQSSDVEIVDKEKARYTE